eukprot:6197041-Pleurochrysis_carterae.AAC.2
MAQPRDRHAFSMKTVETVQTVKCACIRVAHDLSLRLSSSKKSSEETGRVASEQSGEQVG